MKCLVTQFNITVTSKWARWRLKSPASPLFTQPFIQAQIKENIKAPRHWPLCGNSPVTGEFPAQMASNTENVSVWWRHHETQQITVTLHYLILLLTYLRTYFTWYFLFLVDWLPSWTWTVYCSVYLSWYLYFSSTWAAPFALLPPPAIVQRRNTVLKWIRVRICHLLD